MSDTKHITQYFIKIQIDGSDLPEEVLDRLSMMVVEDDLAQPAMFELHFFVKDLSPDASALVGNQKFKLGSEIKISAATANGQSKLLMTGEITALEPEFEQNHIELVVRGYDYSHRLYRGRQTRTFLKQADSNIASTIIGEAGLSADVTATGTQHEYVIQDNQRDMDFLRARAARNGYRITANGKKIGFKPDDSSPPTAPKQEWGKTVIAFRARLSAVSQPNSVEVRGWDPSTKKAIVGKATTAAVPSKIGIGKSGGQLAQAAFGKAAKVTITNQVVQVQDEATKLAQAILDEMSGDYLWAEGTCFGEPTLKAGTQVEVAGVGAQFNGKYYVTSTRHEYTTERGYFTTFIVRGRRPSNVIDIIDSDNSRSGISSVAVGIVTNLNDPQNLGRMKLKFPWLDEQHESDWARVVVPGGGKERGMLFMPEVNDEVLVAFEQGDMNRPYVIGGLWNGKDKPPHTPADQGKIKVRAMKTRGGHTIEFEEDEGSNKGSILVKTAGGRQIKISDTDKGLDIKSEKHTVKLDDQGNAVKIQSGGTLEISGSNCKLSFTANGVELSGSGGKLTIAAAAVELSAQANVAVKGNGNCDIQANGLMNVKTSAILNIQGSLVKIN